MGVTGGLRVCLCHQGCNEQPFAPCCHPRYPLGDAGQDESSEKGFLGVSLKVSVSPAADVGFRRGGSTPRPQRSAADVEGDPQPRTGCSTAPGRILPADNASIVTGAGAGMRHERVTLPRSCCAGLGSLGYPQGQMGWPGKGCEGLPAPRARPLHPTVSALSGGKTPSFLFNDNNGHICKTSAAR